MWNIRHQYQRYKGFLLLELILTIALTSILILSSLSMMEYSTRASIIGESYDEVLLNGRFVIDYIKAEINKADKIISTDLIENFNSEYPSNLGFVIMEDQDKYIMRSEEERKKEGRYRFISYYYNGNEMQRIAYNSDSETYPRADQLKGFNYLGDKILSIEDSTVNFDDKLIHLSISLGNEKREIHKFKSTIYINCEIEK